MSRIQLPPGEIKKKGKYNDLTPFLARQGPPEELKPVPVTAALRAHQFYQDECPALQESDELGYLQSIDVLIEALRLYALLETEAKDSQAHKDATQLVVALAPRPDTDWSEAELVECYVQAIVGYAFRRMSLPGREDELQFLLEACRTVPPGLQVPVLKTLFGEEQVNQLLSNAAGRAGAGASHAHETEEQRARRQAKNKKRNEARKRKAKEGKEAEAGPSGSGSAAAASLDDVE